MFDISKKQEKNHPVPEHDFQRSPTVLGQTINAIVGSNSIMSTASVAQEALQQLMDRGALRPNLLH